MNIGIVGSRSWPDKLIIESFVEFFFSELDERRVGFNLVSGGCKNSPDQYSEDTFRKLYPDRDPVIFRPDWSLGKSAGHIRNTDIAKESDLLICFWDPDSKTSGCLDTVKKMKDKPWFIITPDADYAVNQSIKSSKEFLEDKTYQAIFKFVEAFSRTL